MESKTLPEIMFVLLLLSILALPFNVQPAKAGPRTWTVDDDGPADFHIIQEALNAASEGDTISVYSGLYNESVIVNKAVSLIGVNKNTTIIDGNGASTVIGVEANGTNISGFSIIHGNSAIYVPRYVSNTKIVNCSMYNNLEGLYCDEQCSNTNVIGCDIFNSRYGMILFGSSHVINGCNIFSNDEAGIGLHTPSNNCIIANSVFWNNRDQGAIAVSVSSNHLIKDCYIFNNTVGVSFIGNGINSVTHHAVTNCEISNNAYGIYLSSTLQSYINITDCDISNNEWGVRILPYSYENSIYHNNFVNNTNQAVDANMNSWNEDYPSGGNYWSDYTGVDLYKGPYQNETGSDGIGDSPYSIAAQNKDRYPLINQRPIPDVRKLDFEFYELIAKYMKLGSTYDNLQSGYSNLNTTYNHLLENYHSLQAELNDLQSKYDSVVNELDISRNIIYVLIGTTIVFMVAAVYFAVRKIKSKE